MNKLTIFWSTKNAEHFYWCVDDSRSPSEINSAIPLLESHSILKADLACLADLANKCQVELIVASSDIHVNKVSLPNKAQRHMRKAVPFLLEEQLADMVDNTFIAIGNRLPSGEIPVRGIALKYLQAILAQFNEAEIKLDRIRVDLDLVAQPEEGYQVILINDQVLICDSQGERWSCDQTDFSWLVQKQLAATQDEETLPIAIPMMVTCDEEDIYKLFEQQLPVGRFAPHLNLVNSVEESLAKSKEPLFNLLQAEFEPKVESSPIKNMLVKVATIAAMVLAVHLIYQGSQWIALDAQKDRLAKERTVLWKQAFPGRKVPANPDKALRSFLRTISAGAGEGGFLNLLESSSRLITDLNQLYPTNISYNSARNELRMDVIAKDLPILNAYRDELQKAGHQVDMSSATQRGDTYSSRLIIRR